MKEIPNREYFGATPSAQNVIDIFKGDWTSKFPDAFGVETDGFAGLFEDERIRWADRQLGSFRGKKVLELGPLEGGHSYMLEQLGASEITAIEANSRAYLRCLIVKELCRLHRTRFHLGDFFAYLGDVDEVFEVALACGVLYHQSDPVELIRLLAKRAERVYLWTVYYDEAQLAAKPQIKFVEPIAHETGGYKHRIHRSAYGEALDWGGFCGGGGATSVWLSEGDLLGALQHFGFRVLDVAKEDNPNGPAIGIACERI